ncbi:MAG: aldehyde ferredoxin oxidoreductase C-terminal domain-containing protein [Thermodesulfobacteriota bacterium]
MGIFKGKVVPWKEVLKEHYSIRGWSERGLPTKEKLRELQMEDLANGPEL